LSGPLERAGRLAGSAFRRLRSAGAVLHAGLRLGLRDARELQAATDDWYASGAHYLGREHNRSGLWPWEEAALARHFPACRSILVAAAGGGREAVALARRGLRVEAFDCSPALVRACRALVAEEGLDVRVEHAPPGEVPAGLGPFDGVVVGWTGYMHVVGRAARVRFLHRLRAAAVPGAPLLLSYFARAGDERGLAWTHAVASVVRRLRGSREPVELGDSIDTTFNRHFTPDEIAEELAAGGFELLERHGKPEYPHAVARAAPGPPSRRRRSTPPGARPGDG
jgi:2-polyprenyl-3-methyl-5-hydroxy-6-metoxy-1,4-benzoquinol methylase